MANAKLSALTELAVEPAASDELYVNDGGVSKRIQYSNLMLGSQLPTGVTATEAEINTAADQSVQQLTAGAGITDGASTLHHSSIEKHGGIFYTYLYMDLTGLASSTTDDDIIGAKGADVVVNGAFTDGSNVVVNGTFTGDTDWTKGADWTLPGTIATAAPGTGTVLEPAVPLTVVAGQVYSVVYTMSGFAGGTCVVSIGGTSGTPRGSDATFTELITATDTGNLQFTSDAAADYDIDDVSVALVGDAGWTQGADWLISGNNATASAGTGTVLEPSTPLTVVAGATYEVTYTMSGFSAGTCVVSIGGTDGSARGSDATFTEYLVAGDTTNLKFTSDAAADYDIDDVVVKLVSPAYIGQITAALNGTIFRSCVTWLETPATGADDINFWSATEATGVFDSLITDLTETSLYNKGSAAAAAINTRIDLTANPAADQYLYLVNGEGAVPATYTAGQFILEFWGA